MQYLTVMKAGVDFMSSRKDGKGEHDKAMDAQAAGVESCSTCMSDYWVSKEEKMNLSRLDKKLNRESKIGEYGEKKPKGC